MKAQREKLEKYKTARDRLIQLQIEQVTLEADGFTFPKLGPAAKGNPWRRIETDTPADFVPVRNGRSQTPRVVEDDALGFPDETEPGADDLFR